MEQLRFTWLEAFLPQVTHSVPSWRCTNPGFSGHIFLSVCDSTRESHDSCSLSANGKISTPPMLSVFISQRWVTAFDRRVNAVKAPPVISLSFCHQVRSHHAGRGCDIRVMAQALSIVLPSDHNSLKMLALFFFFFLNLSMCMLKLSHHSTSREDPSETQQTPFKHCCLPLTVDFPLCHL